MYSYVRFLASSASFHEVHLLNLVFHVRTLAAPAHAARHRGLWQEVGRGLGVGQYISATFLMTGAGAAKKAAETDRHENYAFRYYIVV